MSPILDAGQRNLVGDTVAVGILIAEGLEYLGQLVDGFGRFHAHGIQEILVDVGAVAVYVRQFQIRLREGIYAAIAAANLIQHGAGVQPGFFAALIERGGIAAALGEILVQIEQRARIGVSIARGPVGRAEGEHVGQLVAGSHHKGELGLGVGGRPYVNLNLAAQHFGQMIGKPVAVVVVHNVGALGDGDLQRHIAFLNDRRYALIVKNHAVGQTGRAAHHHRRCQTQTQYPASLFHREIPPCRYWGCPLMCTIIT